MIYVRDLCRNFGSLKAVDQLNFDIKTGEVFGLLGPNGAGKSTTVKMMVGMLSPTAGEIEINGMSVKSDINRIKTDLGYVPENCALYENLTGREHLELVCNLHHFPLEKIESQAKKLIDLFELTDAADKRIAGYSKGMKQRLGIAQAMFHNPQIIFLDEPTDGVDPVGRREIRDLMERLRGEGKTIFLNSHLLGEVEQVCNRVAILQQGLLARQGTVAELTRQSNRFVIGLAPGQAFPIDEAIKLGFVAEAADDKVEVELKDGQNIDPVLSLLSEKRLNLRHLVEKKQSLEDVFVSMVDGAEPGTDKRKKRTREVGTPANRRK